MTSQAPTSTPTLACRTPPAPPAPLACRTPPAPPDLRPRSATAVVLAATTATRAAGGTAPEAAAAPTAMAPIPTRDPNGITGRR